jgi:hypothetical protein
MLHRRDRIGLSNLVVGGWPSHCIGEFSQLYCGVLYGTGRVPPTNAFPNYKTRLVVLPLMISTMFSGVSSKDCAPSKK